MDTDELMEIALEMAGMREVPPDSHVYVPGDDLRRILVAIDVGPAELLLARDMGFDGVLAHHPAGGPSTVHFHQVLDRHVELMEAHGVPREAAREAVEELKAARAAAAHAANYDRTPSVARLIGMPFLNVHLPLDEIGRRRMVEAVEGCSQEVTVGEAVRALTRLPEFRAAETRIEVRLGDESNPLGRVAVVHGAGTNGGYPVAKAYFSHGVDTVVYIHLAPGELKRLRHDEELRDKNLMVTGHIASDSLGINPYVARLRQEGLEVECIGGVLEP